MNLRSGILFLFALFGLCACAPVSHPAQSEQVFWLDHDAGFDSDDFIAMVVATRRYGARLVGMSTTLYHPREKAKLTKVFLEALGFPEIPVFAGEGIGEGEEADFGAR